MIQPEELIKIGRIARVHGLAGEVDLTFTDDVFDRVDADYVFLQLDGLPVPFFFDSYRFKNSATAIVKFDDVNNVDQARALCGADVYFPLALVPERESLPDSWLFLTGFAVSEAQGGFIGKVAYVDDRNANLLLSVQRDDGSEVLLPFHEDFLVSLDEPHRTLVMALPEGLMDLYN